MLSTETVRDIRRLLAQGELSHRAIAQRIGVSRGTVGAVARGKRTDEPMPCPLAENSVRPVGLPKRCPTCGGLVFLPCRLCDTRRRLANSRKNRRPRQPGPPGDPLALELRKDHRRRYERVRALKLAQPPYPDSQPP